MLFGARTKRTRSYLHFSKTCWRDCLFWKRELKSEGREWFYSLSYEQYWRLGEFNCASMRRRFQGRCGLDTIFNLRRCQIRLICMGLGIEIDYFMKCATYLVPPTTTQRKKKELCRFTVIFQIEKIWIFEFATGPTRLSPFYRSTQYWAKSQRLEQIIQIKGSLGHVIMSFLHNCWWTDQSLKRQRFHFNLFFLLLEFP